MSYTQPARPKHQKTATLVKPAPVPTPAPQPDIVVTGFRPHTGRGPTLKAFIDVLFANGLHVWNVSYHEDQVKQKRWIAFPGRWIVEPRGTKKGQGRYIPALAFETKEQTKEFQQKALDALDLYLKTRSDLRDPNRKPPVPLPLASWSKEGGHA